MSALSVSVIVGLPLGLFGKETQLWHLVNHSLLFSAELKLHFGLTNA